ncbi:hypothetical protein [Brevibacillus laterosporus]|uniref:hypothetical protein n=1 Tax=Brevibacillus laterosporus TaxID=1465 RepID=UPI003D243E67
MLTKQMMSILFGDNVVEGQRAFTPFSIEDGNKIIADMRVRPAKRFGMVDFSTESHPNYHLNVSLLRDSSEKLLGYVICTKGAKVAEDIMEAIMDEDKGLIIAVNNDLEIEAVFFVDVYDKQHDTINEVFNKNHDTTFIVVELTRKGFMFTDDGGGQTAPTLRLV